MAAGWRTVRVFISSTFRDMQDERDRLAKYIFPELRRRCRERGIEFTEVDLRWGVTEEQAERGEVLSICLAEIENCRPYFIGLLGERYGTVPDKIDPTLVEDHAWIKQYQHRSVTELEILHGVFNEPEMAGCSYFYFRDPEYINHIPSERQADYRAESPEHAEKLRYLKEAIRSSGHAVKENYSDPEAVGQLILEDLWQTIDSDFPSARNQPPLNGKPGITKPLPRAGPGSI